MVQILTMLFPVLLRFQWCKMMQERQVHAEETMFSNLWELAATSESSSRRTLD